MNAFTALMKMIRMEMNLKGNVKVYCYVLLHSILCTDLCETSIASVKDAPHSSSERLLKSNNIIHFQKLYTLFNLNGYFAMEIPMSCNLV